MRKWKYIAGKRYGGSGFGVKKGEVGRKKWKGQAGNGMGR